MKNYNVSDEPVTEVAVDINDIKDNCNEKGRNEECVFLVAENDVKGSRTF